MAKHVVFACDKCGVTTDPIPPEQTDVMPPYDPIPPHGWVRLEGAEAYWAGSNYLIKPISDSDRKVDLTFCGLKCFKDYLEQGGTIR